jgi:hypothetical protein
MHHVVATIAIYSAEATAQLESLGSRRALT